MTSVGVVMVTLELGSWALLVVLVVMTIRWVLSSFSLSLLLTKKLEISPNLAVYFSDKSSGSDEEQE